MHQGAPKTWYGVPGGDAEKFESVMRGTVHSLFKKEPDLHMKLVTMLSPSWLVASRVPVYHLLQHPGEFVVTYPKAYHAGFSHGWNLAEAVNLVFIILLSPSSANCMMSE
jgi:histone demethylase JARID1